METAGHYETDSLPEFRKARPLMLRRFELRKSGFNSYQSCKTFLNADCAKWSEEAILPATGDGPLAPRPPAPPQGCSFQQSGPGITARSHACGLQARPSLIEAHPWISPRVMASTRASVKRVDYRERPAIQARMRSGVRGRAFT